MTYVLSIRNNYEYQTDNKRYYETGILINDYKAYNRPSYTHLNRLIFKHINYCTVNSKMHCCFKSEHN